MELAKPSAAGELFGMSAAVISTLEKTALAIGQTVDTVRRLTTLPLSADGRTLRSEKH